MRAVRFGIIGCGLMGREFASAAARWCHLTTMTAKPEVVAICNRSAAGFDWFKASFPSIAQVTHDYREILANPQVEAVYVALPHHLHEEVYCAAVAAGKHLMGEKPFGIDLAANEKILHCCQEHPQTFVRCASQWYFFPGAQKLCGLLEHGACGRIIEVNAGFLHSSDLDSEKPINWKRMVEYNGEYGCLGDLGMHVCFIPFRAGWKPQNVRAFLSDIIKERPDGRGNRVPCRTWDNATLFCEALDPLSGETFPLTLKTQRIAPGHKNTWFIEVFGTRASARFSTRDPKRLELLRYHGGSEQVWSQVQTGHETAFPTITGLNFEFGSTDAILQMWAAFLHELDSGAPRSRFSSCPTPAETKLSHRLFTAALRSHQQRAVVSLDEGGSV